MREASVPLRRSERRESASYSGKNAFCDLTPVCDIPACDIIELCRISELCRINTRFKPTTLA